MRTNGFQMKQIDGRDFIYDRCRRKYVVLTPEEWVRQQVIHHLIHDLSYPIRSISVEKQIQVGSVNKRFDILVYVREHPWLIIECKRETVAIDTSVLQQLLAYNSSLHVAFITITNGKQLMSYDIEAATWLQGLPDYPKPDSDPI
jgi:hypothetical protein